MSFLAVSSAITLDAQALGISAEDGFAVAVYASAIDEGANELLQGTVGVTFAETASSVLSVGVSLLVSFAAGEAMLSL